MDIATLLIALLVAAVIIGGYLFIASQMQRQKQSAQLLRGINSPDDLYGSDSTSTFEEEEARSPTAEMFNGILMAILPLLGKKVDEELAATRKKMMYAGIQSPDAPSYYLFFQYVGAIVLVVLALPFLLSNAQGDEWMTDMFIGGVMVIIGLWGPKLYLKNATDKRRKTLTRSFPDALDLMLVCVESGLAMDAAFSRVCKELGNAHPEITEEFNRTRLELSLLNDRSKALYNLGERTNITALRALAAALIQTEKFGTSLADTLRVMSDDYRQTRLMEAENKANRLPAMMTIPLITLLLPALFIIILSPAILGIQEKGGLFGNG